MHEPQKQESRAAWEMRAAWATRREMVVVLDRQRHRVGEDLRDAPADRNRVRGYVEHVAASGAYALVWDGSGEAHVPLALVANVHRPHFSEPLDGEPVAPPPPRVVIEAVDGQMEFELTYPEPPRAPRLF